ncbi:hypothetical protein ACNKHM_26245 [Shigella sonnei]
MLRSGAGERETGPGYTAYCALKQATPDDSAILAAREPVNGYRERNRQNCSKLTTLQPLLIHVKLQLKTAVPRQARKLGTATGRCGARRTDLRSAKPPWSGYCPAKARKLEQQQANAEARRTDSIRAKPLSKRLLPCQHRKLEQQQANAEPEERDRSAQSCRRSGYCTRQHQASWNSNNRLMRKPERTGRSAQSRRRSGYCTRKARKLEHRTTG